MGSGRDRCFILACVLSYNPKKAPFEKLANSMSMVTRKCITDDISKMYDGRQLERLENTCCLARPLKHKSPAISAPTQSDTAPLGSGVVSPLVTPNTWNDSEPVEFGMS